MSFNSPENWIDAELRRVPLPPGLIERLRAASETTDEDIDEALLAVTVPAGLGSQLLEIVADEELDIRLCDVAVPAALLEDLAAIPDEEALRDVPVPANLLVALRRVVPQPRRWSPLRLALAASLLLMFTGAYVSSVAGWMMSAYNSSQGITATVLQLPDSPVELTSAPTVPVTMVFADDQRPEASREALPVVDDPFTFAIDTRSIEEQLAGVMPAGYSLTDNILPLRFGILGQNDDVDERGADMEMLKLAEPRGVEAPVSVGFDRQFLVKNRTQPIVTLAASPELYAQRLPLWRSTGSFDKLRERTLVGRLPASHEIHVEDFLAAMDCQYADAPQGKLAIRTAAGPSVFSDSDASLLQIGVQAGPLARSKAVHVTFLVDTSDSMRWSDRLQRVRQALRRFAPQMQAGDRVSLVIYNDLADTLVEDAALEDLATIYEAIDALSAHGGSNFGAGLQQAAMAAESPTALSVGQRRIVLFTDGLPAMSAAATKQVNQLLGELALARIALDVVDVDDSDEPDARLSALAAARGQKLMVGRDAEALHRQLVERAMGASPEIAREASVEIKFNPKAVKAYRLLGHEAVALGGMPAAIESSLLAGESATVLLEVWLHAAGPADVADVEVHWTDATGKGHSLSQQVRRVQFVPSFREAPLSLQAAAVAAEAAEVLRESPFASARGRDLRPLLEVARQVNSRLAERVEYRRFVDAVEQAERVRRTGDSGADTP